MTGTVSLASLGPKLAYYFKPSGKWGTCTAPELLARLRLVDFTLDACQADDLYVGCLGAPTGGWSEELMTDLAHGKRGFTDDDPDAFLFTIDWHGTPTYFVGRGCKYPDHMVKMYLLDVEAVTRATKATEIAELRTFLAAKGAKVSPVDPDPDTPMTGRKTEMPRWFGG